MSNNNRLGGRQLLLLAAAAVFFGFLFLDVLRGKPFGLGYVQWIGMLASAALFVFALKPTWLNGSLHWGLSLLSVISWLIAAVAAVLMVINLIGVPLTTRNQDMYTIPVRYGGKDRLALYTPQQVYAQMYRQPGETIQEYLLRLNQLIFDGTIHYWEDAGIVSYNLRVPLTENWILYFDHYGQIYHFCSAERAIERGASVCTQASVILLSILDRQNIAAREYALDGHTVALVEVDPDADEWWFSDADFGVVLQEDYRQIEADPQRILPYYQAAGYTDQLLLQTLVGYYGPEGNYSQGGIKDFKYCEREELAYQLKWWLPLAGLLQLPLIVLPIRWAKKRLP